jgi:hypothetical protein
MAYCKCFSTAINYGTTALRHVKNAPTVGAARFFACPRLVLLTVGDGRSSCLNGDLGHSCLNGDLGHSCLNGDLGKGEFLASCYS